MPRQNPIPKEKLNTCAAMVKLRKTMKLSRVQFAQLLGMDSSNLTNREHGRSPWKEDELWAAKLKLEDYLEEATEAARETFA